MLKTSLGEEPTLHDDLEPIWILWHRLAAKRPIGMGISSVPFSEILCALDEFGYRGELRGRAIRLIEAMETEYLAFANREAKKRREEQDREAKAPKKRIGKEAGDGSPRAAD